MAQYEIGRMYYFGDGLTDNPIERDYAEALKWLSRAAEQGYFFSFEPMGEHYFQGYGVTQDYQKAFEWFSRSTEHPTGKTGLSAHAAQRIGEMYAEGKGVGQDFIQAYKWMKIGGCDPDLHHEFPIKGKLSTEEREKAELLIKEFRGR